MLLCDKLQPFLGSSFQETLNGQGDDGRTGWPTISSRSDLFSNERTLLLNLRGEFCD
jgi:hypothetical protein